MTVPEAENTQHHYRYHGLTVISDLYFPELEFFKLDHAKSWIPDVVISTGLPPAGTISDTMLAAAGNLGVIEKNQYALRVQQVGDFRVFDGSSIVITPLAGADPASVRACVFSSVWAALSFQRGSLLIHASAVRSTTGAAVFCGDSGTGKSSIAAYLSQLGFTILSDDLCCVDVSPNFRARVYPSIPGVRLAGDVASDLGWKQRISNPDALQKNKHRFTVPQAGDQEPVPLKALYLLGWGSLKISRIEGLSALRGFMLAASYRSRILEQMNEIGNYAFRCALVLRGTPVFEFTRPKVAEAAGESIRFLAESIDRLEI